ncbi:phytochelatin synthase family protein [Methylosinus sp. H3A]|uniref:phytochelatin synthase family protein n=1 Tax=Methylosinus sp. H3A TaxID=2785786 RepID=UPI0018C24A1A|nr:phytochelatin synthase family protein [Methylosinus sp. H3A]MBG0812202.1 phytochelatin synthase family protein [Methylosinus sp. H3A]
MTKTSILRRRFFSLLFPALALCAAALSPALAERLPLSDNLVDLRSAQGREWFLEAEAREAYWPLSSEFVTQKNGSFCGVATLVMLLNGLDIPAPAGDGMGSFSQDNVFSEKTEAVVKRESVLRRGMTLDEFGGLVASFGLEAKVTHAAQSSLEEFRASAVEHLSRKRRHVVVNYQRAALGQARSGHISPLAAYDAKTDRFLLLDVARYKYPPVWISAHDLFDAMNTTDAGNEGRSRGFVLIGPAAGIGSGQ